MSFKKLLSLRLINASNKNLVSSFSTFKIVNSYSKFNINDNQNQIRSKSDQTDKNDEYIEIAENSKLKDVILSKNIGQDLVGSKLKKRDILDCLNRFFRNPVIKKLCKDNYIDDKLMFQAFLQFREHCSNFSEMSPELYIVFYDIIVNNFHTDDLFVHFLSFCKKKYPHLDCIEELKKISDLRLPFYWYPEARKLTRKIYFHSGPTNSGKTYKALENFFSSDKGIYCGPLKLLAVEIFQKSNEKGVDCDLITGEDKKYVKDNPSNHISCTIEMASITDTYDIAIIDEIQMIKDAQRGWAWTRALLGLSAKEIHICGEASAIGIVKDILEPLGEEVIVNNYNRLTKLKVENQAIEDLSNIKDGDCIVCFSKADLYKIRYNLEKLNKQTAIIYGNLPNETKINQAKKFNDLNNPCKIMVSTDAIGMGLNLSIKRIIFYSIYKVVSDKNKIKKEFINASTALQIAGRAGRFNSRFDCGYVTCFKTEDLKILKNILSEEVEPIYVAGLHPTSEQLELFAYHLPNASLKKLIEIFESLCQVDTSNYFICNMDNFKTLADLIEHHPLSLTTRYTFCSSPVDSNKSFLTAIFKGFAEKVSKNEQITFEWLSNRCYFPLKKPSNLKDLVYLENCFDAFELYLWFSQRLQNFPDAELVRESLKEFTNLINLGLEEVKMILDSKKQNVKNLDTNRQSLTSKLIDSGRLTTEMISQLQKEWLKDNISIKKNKPKKS